MKQTIEKWLQIINYQYSKSDLEKAFLFFFRKNGELGTQFKNLNWHTDPKEQEYAVNYLSENMLPSEYIFLVFADTFSFEPHNGSIICYRHSTDKSKWENAAKTIVKIGWPKTDHILLPLFMWLLDPNWPGSAQIRDFLKKLPKNTLQEKMAEILRNPEVYNIQEYEELKDQIQELWEETTGRQGDGSPAFM